MSNVPGDLQYTADHEWARISGNRATVGITDHAQSELTDVVYVELPSVGKTVRKGDVLGVVESVKAVSEIYAPLSGTIVEVNKGLADAPEAVNDDPYGKGWMVVIEASSPAEADGLLDARAYRAHIGE